MGTLAIQIDLTYTEHGNGRTEVFYTYMASTKSQISPTDTSTTNEHSRDPSISGVCIGNTGTTDTTNNNISGGYTGKRIRK